jgi:hypothetical protein
MIHRKLKNIKLFCTKEFTKKPIYVSINRQWSNSRKSAVCGIVHIIKEIAQSAADFFISDGQMPQKRCREGTLQRKSYVKNGNPDRKKRRKTHEN